MILKQQWKKSKIHKIMVIGFENVFKSINVLNLQSDFSPMLLHYLPIDILFNPDSNVSNLDTIKFNHVRKDIYLVIYGMHM